MVSGLHHVEVTVSNMDRSIDFYVRLLGLTLLGRDAEADITPIAGAVGLPQPQGRVRLVVAFLGAGRDVIELIEYREPHGIRIPRRSCDPGIHHFALLVSDMDREYQRLTEAGVCFCSHPILDTDGFTRGDRWAYLADPDGNTVELVEAAH